MTGVVEEYFMGSGSRALVFLFLLQSKMGEDSPWCSNGCRARRNGGDVGDRTLSTRHMSFLGHGIDGMPEAKG